MPNIIVDNRQILKYRGLQTPSTEDLQSQASARRTAILNLGRLATSRSSAYIPQSVAPVTNTPFMRLLPATTDDNIYDFYFPFTPQNIKYSDLSDEIAEIARPSSTPIVVFKSHKLMRISMDFVVAVPYDGLITDVESSISMLRTFATSSHRSIVFFHLDRLMLGGWNYRNGPSNRPPYFNIADMDIEAKQRNSSGKISQASVSLTIIENQNPVIVATTISPFTPLPRLKPPKKPPKPPTNKGRKGEYTDQAPPINPNLITIVLPQ